jgi:hypothetical protein
VSKLPNSKILEIAKPHQNDHGFVYADCVIGFAHDIEAELSRQETEEELRSRFEAAMASLEIGINTQWLWMGEYCEPKTIDLFQAFKAGANP